MRNQKWISLYNSRTDRKQYRSRECGKREHGGKQRGSR